MNLMLEKLTQNFNKTKCDLYAAADRLVATQNRHLNLPPLIGKPLRFVEERQIQYEVTRLEKPLEETAKKFEDTARELTLFREVQNLSLDSVCFWGEQDYLSTIQGKLNSGQELRIHRLSWFRENGTKHPAFGGSLIVGFLDEKILPTEEASNVLNKYLPILQERNGEIGIKEGYRHFNIPNETPFSYFNNFLSQPNFGRK
jgi:hypothetical protein